MVRTGRVVIGREFWRVVAVERPDDHGVERTDYVVELADPKDRDLLGVQRWRELTGKSAMVDWVTASRFFLAELLKAAGEKSDAKNK